MYERILNVYERNLAKKLDILWTPKENGYRFHHTMLDRMSVITKVSRIIDFGIKIAILPLQERTDEPMISEG